MNEKVKERSEQTDKNRKWPWDWRNEALTETDSAKIVKNLPSYARDVYDAEYRIYTSGLPKSYNLHEGFDQYCRVVNDHLQQQCEKAPISLRQQAYQICDEAFEIIEFLKRTTLPQVYPPVITSEPPPTDSFNVADRWDILMRKLDMCVSSSEQQEAGGDAKRIIVAILISLMLILLFELFVYFGPVNWFRNHPHTYGIHGSVIGLILCLIFGFFKPKWRKWCWGTAAIAFLVGLLSLL